MDRLWTVTMMKNRDSVVSIKNFYGTITDIEEMIKLISLMECQPFSIMA